MNHGGKSKISMGVRNISTNNLVTGCFFIDTLARDSRIN